MGKVDLQSQMLRGVYFPGAIVQIPFIKLPRLLWAKLLRTFRVCLRISDLRQSNHYKIKKNLFVVLKCSSVIQRTLKKYFSFRKIILLLVIGKSFFTLNPITYSVYY